ncbi:MAG: DNA cytosine methyltransferase [Oscillospiraceae bacterium]|nr:DNA cytosine methyltransferase [Oscillospiraceae bacterium]
MPIEIYSFFSGLGFLDLGFENAGFNIEFVNEYNEHFLTAYQYARRNNLHTPVYGYSHEDVRYYLLDDNWNKTFPNYTNRANRYIGFIGGPPCPDFSTAGKNKGADGKNGQLTSVYIELIKKRQPDFFVLENVKGLYQTKKHKEFYDRMKQELLSSGYELFDSIENALTYGVPQDRERLILVGFRKRTFGNNIVYKIGNHREFDLDYIKSLTWPTVRAFAANSDLERPDGIIPSLTVEYWFRKNDVQNHLNSKNIFRVKNMQRFISIAEGDISGKSFKRLHRWRYSPTAAYGNNEVHLHPYLPRRISVAEALAIQSLPSSFELLPQLSLSEKFKMIGNGVPYLLALGIANDLCEWIEKLE